MKSLLVTISILAIIGLGIGTMINAVDTVTCTVTPGNYSVSVLPTSDPHGAMTLSATNRGTLITATNAGSLTAKLNIIGADATYSSFTWILSTSAPGTDTYIHAFSTAANPTSGTATGTDPTAGWVSLDKGSTYKTLNASVSSSGTEEFYLDMRTPTAAGAGTSFGSEYSTNVTVAAVAP